MLRIKFQYGRYIVATTIKIYRYQ